MRKTEYRTAVCLSGCAAAWLLFLLLDSSFAGTQPANPKAANRWHFVCSVAAACNSPVLVINWLCARQARYRTVLMLSGYISFLTCTTYARMYLGVAYLQSPKVDHLALFVPSRCVLHMAALPALCWILGSNSKYSLLRSVYVMVLSFCMTSCASMATIPGKSWGHACTLLTTACALLPELHYHMCTMVSHSVPGTQEQCLAWATAAAIRITVMLCMHGFILLHLLSFTKLLTPGVTELLTTGLDWLTFCLLPMLLVGAAQRMGLLRDVATLRHMMRYRDHETLVRMVISTKQKQRFVSDLTHKLQGPVNSIFNSAEKALGMQLSPKLFNTFNIIYTSSSRVLTLATGLLDASDMKDLTPIMLNEDIDLLRILHFSMQMFVGYLPPQVQLRSRLFPVPSMQGDEKRLLQVVQHLIENAMKFTDKGFIRVGAGYDQLRNRVFVYVRDTGTGICRGDVIDAFELFGQAVGGRAHHHGGTGVGLYFVKTIVAGHGGTIAVRSRLDVGSMFVVYLPILHHMQMLHERSHSVDAHMIVDISDFDNLTEPSGAGVCCEASVTDAGLSLSNDRGSGAPQMPAPAHATSLLHRVNAAARRCSALGPVGQQPKHCITRSIQGYKHAAEVLENADRPVVISHQPHKESGPAVARVLPRISIRNHDVREDVLVLLVASNSDMFPVDLRFVMASDERSAMLLLHASLILPDVVIIVDQSDTHGAGWLAKDIRAHLGYALPIAHVMDAPCTGAGIKMINEYLASGVNSFYSKYPAAHELQAMVQMHARSGAMLAAEVHKRMLCLGRFQMRGPHSQPAGVQGAVAREAAVLCVRLGLLSCGPQDMAPVASVGVLRSMLNRHASEHGLHVYYTASLEAFVLGEPWEPFDQVMERHARDACSSLTTSASQLLQALRKVGTLAAVSVVPSAGLAFGPICLHLYGAPRAASPHALILGRPALLACRLMKMSEPFGIMISMPATHQLVQANAVESCLPSDLAAAPGTMEAPKYLLVDGKRFMLWQKCVD